MSIGAPMLAVPPQHPERRVGGQDRGRSPRRGRGRRCARTAADARRPPCRWPAFCPGRTAGSASSRAGVRALRATRRGAAPSATARSLRSASPAGSASRSGRRPRARGQADRQARGCLSSSSLSRSMIRSSARRLVDCTASRKKFWGVEQAIRGRDRDGRLEDLRLGQADLDPGAWPWPALPPAPGARARASAPSTTSGGSLVALLEVAGDFPAAQWGGRHDAHGDLLLIDHQADRRPQPEPIPRLHGRGHSRWLGQGVKRRRATEPGRPHDGQDHSDFGMEGREVTSGALLHVTASDQPSRASRSSRRADRTPG